MGLRSCDDLATESEDATLLFDPIILHDISVKPPNGSRYAPSGYGWGEKARKRAASLPPAANRVRRFLTFARQLESSVPKIDKDAA
jgi:hypothetical protein